jgi:HPt (histidine-containing phosphotransfer) domain-containing protein
VGLEEQCRELDDAAAAGDALALGKAAHRLKGSAGIFIGSAAAVQAGVLEQECKCGMPADAGSKVAQVLAAARELNAELHSRLHGQ